MNLPPLPTSIANFIPYLDRHSDTTKALEPFKVFEGKLREVYAQDPSNPAIADQYVNVVPLFAGHEETLKIRARDVEHEPPDVKDKYLLPLADVDRKPNGSSAIVTSIKEFKTNFNLFSESSLIDLDWSNVVAAGSSVVTSLLPIPSLHGESKRALRAYYHEKLAPASDVDLFIYGLSQEQAIEKIKQIEGRIRDSILSETTTIRTKNAITIASEYPTRHVQIVLRLYKSVSEILTGFDVDCACAAYDGNQVWATPRAIAALVTQINTIDLTRRSPSYENRLSKYSHRGFEVHWPGLDRSRVDPTVFERSFSRVKGLARLLVLEKLPHPNDRDTYLAKRRAERGRPALPWNARYRHQLPGNVKDDQPDDVAEWVEEDDISNYHTFTVPYGPKYTAKRIEKLLFTKDLLLNAEWNKSKDRVTDLHRHPAFFGSVNDVIHDCCGFCPEQETDEDIAIFEEEEKIYVSGDIKFLTDDPGRQAIGSFNPLSDDDWTEMAYIGDTSPLCQAIVDGDLEKVQDWLSQEGVDVNRRDHTGRTPLHLAALCSTPEILQCLVDHGARIVARVVDGFTALHIAAYRGNQEMVKTLLIKSEANQEEEDRKYELRKSARRAARAEKQTNDNTTSKLEGDDDHEDIEDLADSEDSDSSDHLTEGSFVKVKEDAPEGMVIPGDEVEDEPDFYDVDVLAWDSPVSPLHLAIIGGHSEVIELLVDTFGADILLPVKLMHENDRKRPKAAILTITLALQLSMSEAKKTVQTLLSLGASSTQADMNQVSALHYVVNDGKTKILEMLRELDGPAAALAINHVLVSGWQHNAQIHSPLLTALRKSNADMVDKLLEMGAKMEIDFETFAHAYHRKLENASQDPDEMRRVYERSVDQPIIEAARHELPEMVLKFLDSGVNPNTLPKGAYLRTDWPDRYYQGEDKSLLDIVQSRLKALRQYLSDQKPGPKLQPPQTLNPAEHYLKDFQQGTYQYWLALFDLQQANAIQRTQWRVYERELKDLEPRKIEGEAQKKQAVQLLLQQFEDLEQSLLNKGAKGFYELFPDIKEKITQNSRDGYHSRSGQQLSKTEPYDNNQTFLVPDLTPKKKEEYFRLFEAAWKGDLSTVKALTLSIQDSGGSPLQIAVQDLRGFSPFAIAVIRGHEELARAILEIANLQYAPKEKTDRYRYTMDPGDSDSTDSADSDDVHINIFSELIDDKFTVDDIAVLANNVGSKVSPMTMLCWHAEVWRALGDNKNEESAKKLFMPHAKDLNVYINGETKQSWLWFNAVYEKESRRCRWSLIRFAIVKNDLELLKFLLHVGRDLAGRKEDEDASKVFSVSQSDFDFAVRLGRTEMVGEIIKVTGAAIPLHKLVQKSGVKIAEKPKYYQGLSVYGKKRKDWAEAGRFTTRAPVESELAPLLSVTFEGNLETVEYFLSDAPLRRYQEFVSTYKDDWRIQTLTQAKGGINKSLKTWLSSRSNFAIHLAVMSKPQKDGSHRLLDFLIRKMPETVDTKSPTGATPLQLAFKLKRYYAAKALIAAGANQATRNDNGENVLHTIMNAVSSDSGALLQSVLTVLDQKLLEPMFLERSGGTEPGSLTPLASFIRTSGVNSSHAEDVLDVILRHSCGKDLVVMDGAGDYPLHTLVRNSKVKLASYIINYSPSLLHRENATGMTPMDVVSTSYLRSRMDHPPQVIEQYNHYANSDQLTGILNKPTCAFIKRDSGDNEDTEEKTVEEKMWKTCSEMAKLHPGKRTLVSLFDANEVAKRLAAQQRKRNEEARRRHSMRLAYRSRGHYDFGNAHDGDFTSQTEEGKSDVTSKLLETAQRFRKWDLELWKKELNDPTDAKKIEGNHSEPNTDDGEDE